MLYLWPNSSSMVSFANGFGVLTTAYQRTVPLGIREGRSWAMDNSCFTKRFDFDRFQQHLAKLEPYRSRCLFIAVPDVVGDARATLQLWDTWAPQFAGWPLAFVAQDGQEALPTPPAAWLFVGGTDAFKLGRAALTCIQTAKARGQCVHVGRVNSIRRFRYFASAGADSADGTGPIYEPDNYKRLLTAVVAQHSLHPGLSCSDRVC